MAGTWADLGPSYEAWRDDLLSFRAPSSTADTVVVSPTSSPSTPSWVAAVGDDRVMHVPAGQRIDHDGGHRPGPPRPDRAGGRSGHGGPLMSDANEPNRPNDASLPDHARAAWTHTGYAQQIVFGPGALGRLRRRAQGGRRASGAAGHHGRAGRPPTTAPSVVKAARSRRWGRPSPRSPRTCRRPWCRPRCCRPGATASTASSRSAAVRAPTPARRCASSPSRSAGTPGSSFADRPVLPHVVDHRRPTRAPSSRRSSA